MKVKNEEVISSGYLVAKLNGTFDLHRKLFVYWNSRDIVIDTAV